MQGHGTTSCQYHNLLQLTRICFSFYCIVLLTTLFVSSCYWQPFSLDDPLTTPWSENITTFADALKASLPANSTPAFPSVMRAVDRCWCDFTGSFFEPFDISHWEYLSVHKVTQDLERKRKAAATPEIMSRNKESSLPVFDTDKDSSLSDILWNILLFPFSLQTFTNREDSPSVLLPKPDKVGTTASIGIRIPPETSPTAGTSNKYSEYDLRPYGLGLVVDLGW